MLSLLCALVIAPSTYPEPLSATARQEMWETAKDKYLGVSEKLKALGVSVELAKEDILHGRSPVDSLLSVNCILTGENTMKVEIETHSGGGEGVADVKFGGAFEWGKEIQSIAGHMAISGADNGIASEYSYNRVNGESKIELEGNRSIWDAKVQMGDAKAGPVAAGVKLGPLKVLVDPYVMIKEVIREAPEMVEAVKEKIGGVSTRVNLTNLIYALKNSNEPPPNFAANRLVVSISGLSQAIKTGQASTLGDLRHIDGVLVDSAKGDVLLYGTADSSAPPIPTDVVVAMARVTFVNRTDAYISIDPDWAHPSATMHARVGGVPDELTKTELVRRMLAADYQMKTFILGTHPILGVPNMIDQFSEHPERAASLGQRFWITPRPLSPGDVRIGVMGDKTLYQFESRPIVRTNAAFADEIPVGTGIGSASPESELAAAGLTDHFADAEKQFPESGFGELRQILELSTLFTLLRTVNLPETCASSIRKLADLQVAVAEVPNDFKPLEIVVGKPGTHQWRLSGGVRAAPDLSCPMSDSESVATAGSIHNPTNGWFTASSPVLDPIEAPSSLSHEALSVQLIALAQTALQKNEAEEAIKLAQLAVKLSPMSLDARLMLTRASVIGGHWDAVERAASAVLEMDPNSFDGHLYKAFAIFEQGGKTKAYLDAVVNGTIREACRPVYVEIEAALKANPNRGVTFYLCSLIDNLALDPKAAIVDLSAALEVQPDYEMALRDRAIRYKEVGDLAHAMQDANLFLATRPGDVKMKALKAELEKVVQK